MNKIVHISDLHFGTEEKKLTEGLVERIKELNPEVLVVSGDLTQRARSGQYKKARKFLDRLSCQKIIVPGNHDIPLFDVFRRFFWPLGRYKKYITSVMNPLYYENGLAILGINTARSFTWKQGRISYAQIEDLEDKLCSIPDDAFKVIVTHHPFIPPPDDEGIKLVGRSAKALRIVARCKIDLLLAGHLHQGYSGDVRPYYPEAEKSSIVAQAGTAISRRIRSEPNGFNFISLDRNHIDITIQDWNGEKFIDAHQTHYELKNEEWVRAE